jgi:hypothetical protein
MSDTTEDTDGGFKVATCLNCSVKHLPSRRVPHTAGAASTKCPDCHGLRFKVETFTHIPDGMELREKQIVSVIESVDGVGENVVENIRNEFDPLLKLAEADVEQLAEVPYVKEGVAEEILERI